MDFLQDTVLAQPELRFPLNTRSRVKGIQQLYRAAVKQQWNPASDVPWEELGAGDLPEKHRVAARLRWSRSAWGEYGAISESPALQIRFYQERREPDLMQFFAIRTQEESRHAEVCYRMAELLGGYYKEPPTGELAEYLAPGESLDTVVAGATPAGNAALKGQPDVRTSLYSHGVRRMALDPNFPTDAIIAGLVCAAEQVTFDQFMHMIAITPNPVAKRILSLIARDETRHVAFGWRYIESRLSGYSRADRDALARGLEIFIEEVELKGHHHPWLRAETPTSLAEREAFRLTHEAGLGASVEELEKPVLIDTFALIRRKVRDWGITLRPFHHPKLGTV